MITKELREYFENMYKDIDENIILDDEQINAIINDDKYTLVIAGAGTGKTTTLVSKVKYLVDIKNVDPQKILVISYTKKAVLELQERINDEFNIPAKVTTFHSLAYNYVSSIFKNKKCVIVDINDKEKIFYDYMNKLFKEKKIAELMDTFNSDTLDDKYFFYGKYFSNHYKEYDSYDEYFENYKKQKLDEACNNDLLKTINEWIDKRINSEYIISINGELVKSASEAIIANFLFKHGINYKYEEVYTEIVNNSIYKPDFTLNLAGQKVYLEYFGMNDKKYNKIKDKKIEFHTQQKNKFIYLENLKLDEIEYELDKKLREMGFIYQDRNLEEIYNQILNNNKLSSVFKIKKLFFKTIDAIKQNINRSNYIQIIENELQNNIINREIMIKQYHFINDFYYFYKSKLTMPDTYGFDYSDLIYYANKYIDTLKKGEISEYDYIIIDEYQDISNGEYLLSKNTTERNDANVFAVGDDWQSIYSFNGSNIKYITNFEKYYQNATILKITNTYRNSQELIDIAGNFIKKNPYQINKDLISQFHLSHPIHFITYDDQVKIDDNGEYIIDEMQEYNALKKVLLKIYEKTPEHRVLIVGRNNSMIDKMIESDEKFIDDLGSRVRYASISELYIDAMTIHKAKGLTYDEVIIIGLTNEFPHEPKVKFWIEELFKFKPVYEPIMYAEERRILYVALTRTKNNVYIMYNMNPKNRSNFADELYKICKESSRKI